MHNARVYTIISVLYVMSETPKKIVKRTGRKAKEASANDACRFCNSNLKAVCGSKPSFENLFKPSGRQDSQNLILANACESIGFELNRSETLSDRVCKPCGRKIRNAAELYKFVKEAVSSTIVKEQNDTVSDDLGERRQLPSTVTPDRNEPKKSHNENKESTCVKSRTRKSLFLDTEERDSPSLTIASQDNSLLTTTTVTQSNYFDQLPKYIEGVCDINKQNTQAKLKVIIAYPNGDITARETFDGTTKSVIKNLSLKNWKTVANLVLKHPQLKQYIIEALERGVSDEFTCLSKSETILKGREVDEVIAFNDKLLVHEVSVLCPLWHACIKGACGKKSSKKASPRKSAMAMNSMALATASLARVRNATLSAFAYRVSTILFHSGTKYDDILRLSRLGICMSPDSTMHFQRKLGENHESKILFWKKTSEQTLSALNMLEAMKTNQVPVLEKDDMEITTTINLDEQIVKGYSNFDPSVYEYCKTLLENVMSQKEECSINSDALEDAIREIHNDLPIYK